MTPAEQQGAERTGTGSPSTGTQVAAGLASLAEAWLRDTALYGVWLFSLVVVVCGFAAADGPAYAALGLVAGVVAVVVPTAAVVRKARPARIWLALLVGALVDAAALAVVLAS
jgi:hypothetical protein